MLTLCVLLSIRVPISYITDGNKIKEMFGFIFLIFIRPFFRFLVVNFFFCWSCWGVINVSYKPPPNDHLINEPSKELKIKEPRNSIFCWFVISIFIFHIPPTGPSRLWYDVPARAAVIWPIIIDTKCLSIKHFCAIGGPRALFLLSPPLYQNN